MTREYYDKNGRFLFKTTCLNGLSYRDAVDCTIELAGPEFRKALNLGKAVIQGAMKRYTITFKNNGEHEVVEERLK